MLDFEFSGDGEHDYLWLEKTGANTAWVAARLAEYGGVAATDVGFSGMKDRHALTRQWFSVRRPARQAADWGAFSLPEVRILGVERHRRKLRRGAHRANRFVIVVRAFPWSDGSEALLSRIPVAGVPNYFGEQRFGIDAGNLDAARSLFAGRRLPRHRRSLALSAARSWLFNEILAERISLGTWDSLRPGDRASLDGSGSHFEVTDVTGELSDRCRRLDLHPSGEMWGRGSPASSGDVAALERSVADRDAGLKAGLEACVDGARRALRLSVREFDWVRDGEDLRLGFVLARGGYATAVLRELCRYRVTPS